MDVRPNHNELDIGLFEGNRGVGKSGAARQEMQIYCDYKGEEIGSMMFYAYEGWPLNRIDSSAYKTSEVVSQMLYVKEVRVHDAYQNMGIGQLIYKKFGEVYAEKFQGWPVGRNFANPVAEYAYRKAVALGYISEMTMTEQYIKREYDTTEQKDKANELREKLPENVRGPQTWAKVAEKADYRNMGIDVNVEEKTFPSGRTKYSIKATSKDGKVAGDLEFSAYSDHKVLEVTGIDVFDPYLKSGLGTRLYQEFGKIYNEKYDGWAVARHFINPVAEYAFRKAVSLGYISSNALTEDAIERSYSYPGEKELAKDLRNKLPEQYRGPEVWAKIAAKSSYVDVRGYTMSYTTSASSDPILESQGVTGIQKNTIKITSPNGENFGTMIFYVYENIDSESVANFESGVEGIIPKVISVDNIKVPQKYQGLGFGMRLYEEFGTIYSQNFEGVPVARYFVNPVAEYSFRKAVSLGYISENALTEDYISRGYVKPEQQQKAIDLRQKLPEQYRGPEVWAKRLSKHLSKQMLTTSAPKINESDINYSINESTTRDIRDNEQKVVNINLSYKGDQVAYLMFTVDDEQQQLYIENIEVWDVYQGLGLAQYLYKKFGELYRSNYSGWTVAREFQNPAAEAAFNKAIEKGWVPPEAFSEDHTRRSY